MKLYSSNDEYKLYHGNMLDMLEVIKPNSIDSIITDPPYGLTSIVKRFGKEDSAEAQYGKDGSFQRLSKGFMGKEWDGSGIEYNINAWRNCYEVLKPGGYLLAFGGSRTFHRIACAIEDAGFEIRDTIMWLYGSGFPKSMDISKSLDKRNGRNENKFKELGNYLKEKIIDTDNICAEKIGFSPALVRFWKLGERIPNKETWLKLKSIYNLDNDFDWLIEREEAERKVIGRKEKQMSGWNMDGTTKFLDRDITLPLTDLAKQWQGWGTALKPSYEPIIVARKPVENTVVDNVMKYGVGGINIDECRVGVTGGVKKVEVYPNTESKTTKFGCNGKIEELNNGRFPANTILTYDETDFKEVCGGMPDTKSGNISKEYKQNTRFNIAEKGKGGNLDFTNCYGDSGSASRYFYCAKASKKDRDDGMNEFEEKQLYYDDRRGNSFDIFVKRDEDGKPTNNKRKNIHPTVKPIELMQYLIRLVTPKGGVILDPFNGSGSTGKAAMYENAEKDKGYKYIGIELTDEYLPISKARIESVYNKKTQTSLF